MNLADFVSETLTAIVTGVQDAQGATEKSGDLINPGIMYGADSAPKGKYYATQDRVLVHMVEFDVALTVQDNAEAGAKAGVVVFGIGLGGSGKMSASESSVSRVKFQVPLALSRKQR